MSSEPKVDDLSIATQLVEHQGNLALVARALSSKLRIPVKRSYVKGRIDRSAALMGVVEEIRETLLDYAEANLARRILAGDSETSKFFLLTIGRDRGYTRTEVIESSTATILAKRLVDARAAQRAGQDQPTPDFIINGAKPKPENRTVH